MYKLLVYLANICAHGTPGWWRLNDSLRRQGSKATISAFILPVLQCISSWCRSTRASFQTAFVQRHKTTKTALETRVLFGSKSARINKQNGLWLIHTFSRDFNWGEVMFRPTCTRRAWAICRSQKLGQFCAVQMKPTEYANEVVCSNMTVVETARTDRSFGKWCFALKVLEADAFVTTCVSVSFCWWKERLIGIGEWRAFEWFWGDILMLKRYCFQFGSFDTVKKVELGH